MAVASREIERPDNRGFGCVQITEIVGRSETSVYNRLKAAGTWMRSRFEGNKKFLNEIAKVLYYVALSASQIGHLLRGHPTTTVKRL